MNNTASPDPAMQPASVYIDPFPDTLAPRHFQGIPGIACTADGTLWATWYGGGENEGPDNYVMLTCKRPGQTQWPSPWLIVRHDHRNVRSFDPTLWVDPQGKLWLFWAQGFSEEVGKIWDGRVGVWGVCCADPINSPKNWSQPNRFCHGIMMNKPTIDDQGNWLMPVAIWVQEPYHPDVPETMRGALVGICSDQKHATLSTAAKIPNPIFDEHHVIPLRDGRWALWARTQSMTFAGAVSYSSDRGQTWTEGQLCNIPCPNSRFFIKRLQSGALLLISHQITQKMRSHDSAWTPRSHLTAWLSDDEGQTWHSQLLLDEREQVSYPDVDQTPNGTIHVIYDWQRYKDLHILLTSFTEEQLRDGTVDTTPQIVNHGQ